MVLHGAVDDVLLRHRPGKPAPKAGDLAAAPQALLKQVQLLQAQVHAMRQSTSWRITAPLRALRRLGR